jgi:hypothetical protein
MKGDFNMVKHIIINEWGMSDPTKEIKEALPVATLTKFNMIGEYSLMCNHLIHCT